jgi:general secretion pathway protein G
MPGVRRFRAIAFRLVTALVTFFAVATLLAVGIRWRTHRAEQTKLAVDYRALTSALERYHHDFGYYPPTGELGDLSAGGYVKRVPLDPWGCPYSYASNGRTYTLRSSGGRAINGMCEESLYVPL